MADAKRLLGAGERLFAADALGWDQATDHGLAAEKAVRDAGGLMAERAEHLAADKVEEIDTRWRAEYGSASPEEHALHCAQQVGASRARAEEIIRLYNEAAATGDEETAEHWRPQAIEERERHSRLAREAHSFTQGTDPWSKERNKALADAYRQVVAEQRALGVPAGGLTVHPSSQKPAVRRLEQALNYYPTDWIEDSNRPIVNASGVERQLRVRTTRGRAYYAHESYAKVGATQVPVAELCVDTAEEGCQDKGISTAIHEFGHRAEQVRPQIADLERTFLARRTSTDGTRDRLVRYNSKTRGPATARAWTGRGEWVRPDDFLDQYVGKSYGPNLHAREVFSMGIEGLFAGRFAGFKGNHRYKADLEHRDLTLGILATA